MQGQLTLEVPVSNLKTFEIFIKHETLFSCSWHKAFFVTSLVIWFICMPNLKIWLNYNVFDRFIKSSVSCIHYVCFVGVFWTVFCPLFQCSLRFPFGPHLFCISLFNLPVFFCYFPSPILPLHQSTCTSSPHFYLFIFFVVKPVCLILSVSVHSCVIHLVVLLFLCFPVSPCSMFSSFLLHSLSYTWFVHCFLLYFEF